MAASRRAGGHCSDSHPWGKGSATGVPWQRETTSEAARPVKWQEKQAFGVIRIEQRAKSGLTPEPGESFDAQTLRVEAQRLRGEEEASP